MARRITVALVYGTPVGMGGLGMQALTALLALSGGDGEVHAFGPQAAGNSAPPDVIWHRAPPSIPFWKRQYTWLRWRTGRLSYLVDRRIGRWASREIERLQPDLCYVFTQVGLETLLWAQRTNVASILDNPNGHIRNFRRIYVEESRRWCSRFFLGHPTPHMVQRVEREYDLAQHIRVSSQWARRSMIEGGVPAAKIVAIGQPIDLDRFRPTAEKPPAEGPLRVCFIGSLDLRKGFVYLLRAIRAVGSARVELRIAGSTGDRWCRKLFQAEVQDVNLRCVPGDPLSTYAWAEVLILPTLEDGFGFVVPEAMASGLPVIVTDTCGAAELVHRGRSGWIVPSADVNALIAAITAALNSRNNLPEMGRCARMDIEKSAGCELMEDLRRWFYPVAQNSLETKLAKIQA